jgi:uncharacterized protein with HEPN domain
MPVHVDELVSEVSAEAPPTAPAAATAVEWQELARMRDLQAQALRNAWRTAAQGFDD